MNSAVLSSLIPVVLLIAIGYAAVSARLIRAEASKDLSTLVFSVLTPALLFRTMNTVHVERLDFKPVTPFFAGAILMFAAMLAWSGVSRRSAVLALSASDGNVFMFSQHSKVAEELVTASVAVSTLLALVTVSLVMALVPWL